MPHGLEGKALDDWVDEFDMIAEPHKRRILFDACKTADLIKRLDGVAAKAPVTVKGYMGQARLNFAPPEDD